MHHNGGITPEKKYTARQKMTKKRKRYGEKIKKKRRIVGLRMKHATEITRAY